VIKFYSGFFIAAFRTQTAPSGAFNLLNYIKKAPVKHRGLVRANITLGDMMRG
jgi:hypothetical protein